MLKNCVVLEDAEGNLKYYNCAVDIVVDGTMTIIPDEPMVETAYIKLSKTWNVKLKGTGTTNEFKQLTGFHKMNFDVQKEK
jgi:hypothetical protein